MLLEDLIDTKIKSIKSKKDLNQISKPSNLLGTGTIASVKADANDPHMVNRTTSKPVLSSKPKNHYNYNRGGDRYDSYKDYAEYLIKNKIPESNPWFPRIYKIKDFHDKSSKRIQRYTLEKLEKINTLTKKDILHLIEKLFSFKYRNDFSDYSSYDLRYILDSTINNFFNGQYTSEITDETLLDAKHILDKFAEDTDNRLDDIGGDNIMLRRGPYGVQLVITDPTF